MKMSLLLLCIVMLFPLSAQAVPENDTYAFDSLVSEINSVSAPQIKDGHIIFTARHQARFVGIAFDFEHFRTIHPFSLRKIRDVDGTVTDSWFFYILPIPQNLTSLSYRLIIDGLWTTDPENDQSEYDVTTGIRLSKVTINSKKPVITNQPDQGTVHFVYKGTRGQNIRLGGSFTNWDSWIYYLNETKPGIYELNLPLPEGTYYYSFYHGMTAMIDKGNPNRAYTQDGRTASVITVR